MKINKILGFFIASLMLMFSACEPIVDEEILVNTTDVAGVELVATQSTTGGNKIELNMVTPGITGYWDYNLGRAFTNRVEFIYPIPGEATFTFTGTLGEEFFTKTIDVQIDVLDTPLDEDWYDLVSNDTSAGKTWVFTTTPGNGNFWYMCAPDDASAWDGVWWNAGDCCAPDPNGKMTFDLNGGANYTYYSDAGAAGQVGSFNLDVEKQTIAISGVPFLGDNERGSPNDTYQIISLTEDELIDYVPRTIAGDSGWTWIFKPQ